MPGDPHGGREGWKAPDREIGKPGRELHPLVEERERAPIPLPPQKQRETQKEDSIRDSADTSGEALAEHKCRPRSGAGEEFLHNAEVALPDDVDAVKNGHE